MMCWGGLFFVFFLSLGILNSSGKVDPPNYNFKLTDLEIFYPDKSFNPIKEKYKDSLKLVSEDQITKLYKVSIRDKRYVFPLYLNVYKERILDFYTRLPAYFLHNVFHQSIINLFGKQNEYKLVNGTALYRWEKGNLKIVYSGTCTLNCFPVFFTAYNKKYPEEELAKFLPYYLQLQGQENPEKKK